MNRFVLSTITVTALSIILGLFPSAARSKELTTQEVAHQCLPSIVSITVLDAQGEPAVQGSGFVIGANQIATALHFFDNAHSVTINYPSGRSEPVYGMINYDPDRDICILYANTNGVQALPLGSLDDVQVGDPVVALGCPAGLGASVSTGIVSGIHNVKGTKIVQTTAPISHESAGGALIDRRGRVLGITSFMIDDGQNLNFAYASYYASQLIPRGLLQYWSWDELELLRAKDAAKNTPSTTSTTPAATQSAAVTPTTQPATASSTPAADTVTDKPLAGLKGFDVEVDSADSDLKADGIDADALKASAIKRLQDAHFHIYDGIRSQGNDSGASLFLTYNRIPGQNGADDTYNIQWQLVEVVTLTRDKPINIYAQVWDSDIYGHVDHADMPKTVSDTTDRCMDDLIKAYNDQNGTASSQPATDASSTTPTQTDTATSTQSTDTEAVNTYALNRVPANKVLVGLKSVSVDIADLDQTLIDAGVTTDSLRKDAVDRLQKAGITLLDHNDPDNPSGPILLVHLQLRQNGDGPITYSTYIELLEAADIVRDTPVHAFATTWARQDFDSVAKSDIAQRVQDSVGDSVDTFIKVYQQQNGTSSSQ